MNLFIEYYTSNNQNRDWEYKTCISENIKNELIKKIFVFVSDDSVLDMDSDKIQIVKLEKRPSFKFLFEWCNENHPNEICIIANTDIFFDNSLKELESFDFSNKFLALTRWDVLFKDNQWLMQYYDFPWRGDLRTSMFSQDTWIFKSPIKISDDMDFNMGKPGCDNRIVQVLNDLGYDVNNPSKLIITKHLHLSNHRTYSPAEMVNGPYLLVDNTDDLNKDSDKKTILSF